MAIPFLEWWNTHGVRVKTTSEHTDMDVAREAWYANKNAPQCKDCGSTELTVTYCAKHFADVVNDLAN